ncbi:GL19776 [Drosophila persimilis]|uniref:GL19776 n=1 Tax=Drosophila persimilis TaxID=7234 RepID=B4GYM4_DROPE|nr:GL19776 [Drosophila persimilis]
MKHGQCPMWFTTKKDGDNYDSVGTTISDGCGELEKATIIKILSLWKEKGSLMSYRIAFGQGQGTVLGADGWVKMDPRAEVISLTRPI